MERHIMGKHSVPEEYRMVWDAMWQSLTRISPVVEMEGETRTWERTEQGCLSGATPCREMTSYSLPPP